jgi:hypothetical protein
MPVVGSGDGNRMSLSQMWCSGGSGSQVQTVEVGWQVAPKFYRDDYPHLFIYWTPDAYQSGCYNLTCPAFYQSNPGWIIGGFLNFSTAGKTQYSYDMIWYSYEGIGWVLYINNSVVGWYPFSIFNGGALTKNATFIEFGGEVTGTNPSPQMGSGAFANAGYGKAAFQEKIYYAADSGPTWKSVKLVMSSGSEDCYTTALGTAPLITPAFYFGGPGGSC